MRAVFGTRTGSRDRWEAGTDGKRCRACMLLRDSVYIIAYYSNKRTTETAIRGCFSSQKAQNETRKRLYSSHPNQVHEWKVGDKRKKNEGIKTKNSARERD